MYIYHALISALSAFPPQCVTELKILVTKKKIVKEISFHIECKQVSALNFHFFLGVRVEGWVLPGLHCEK